MMKKKLERNQSEFIKEMGKEKSFAVLSSTMIEPGEDEEEEEKLVDFNKSIAGELDVGGNPSNRGSH